MQYGIADAEEVGLFSVQYTVHGLGDFLEQRLHVALLTACIALLEAL